MNPESHVVLADLLRAALTSITITQGASGRISPRDYRRMVQQYRDTLDVALRLQMSTYQVKIGDPIVREAILTMLRDELKPYLREDMTFSASFAIVGGFGGGSSAEGILKNLVRSAILRGPDRSASEFYGAIKRGYIAYQEYFLLEGMQIENEIQVCDSMKLTPPPSDTSRLPSLLPDMFNSTGIDFASKTLLRVDVSVSPLLHKPAKDYTLTSGPDRHFKRSVHSAEVIDFNLDEFIKALTLVGDHPVQSIMTWTHLDAEHVFNLSSGSSSSYSYSTVANRHPPSTVFSETRVREAVDLYFKLNGLPQKARQHLQVPLDRWMKSKTQQSFVDKMIDLGIAFESFYLRGIRDELTFRFSLRAALFLGEGIEQRKKLKKELEEIYRNRSAAVHEGKLPDHVKIDGQRISISQFIERSQELFKLSVLKVIEDRCLPDWTKIELGGDH